MACSFAMEILNCKSLQLLFFTLVFIVAASAAASGEFRLIPGGGAWPINTEIRSFYYQEYEVTLDNAIMEKATMESLNTILEPHNKGGTSSMTLSSSSHRTRRITRRFLLSGLGSSPPRCRSKCGRCMPCFPVHVPLPPGKPVTAEYYPEAWRCKCGNRLFQP